MPEPRPPADVTSQVLREAMGCFATGVAIITSLDDRGAPVGTTANAISSLSLEPPLILVCFDRASVTLRAIVHHHAFVVNVLSADHRELSTSFARSGSPPEVWHTVSHHVGATGVPRIDDTVAAVECRLETQVPGGDHEIVIGHVTDIELGDAGRDPLLFFRGGYAALADVPAPSR